MVPSRMRVRSNRGRSEGPGICRRRADGIATPYSVLDERRSQPRRWKQMFCATTGGQAPWNQGLRSFPSSRQASTAKGHRRATGGVGRCVRPGGGLTNRDLEVLHPPLAAVQKGGGIGRGFAPINRFSFFRKVSAANTSWTPGSYESVRANRPRFAFDARTIAAASRATANHTAETFPHRLMTPSAGGSAALNESPSDSTRRWRSRRQLRQHGVPSVRLGS